MIWKPAVSLTDEIYTLATFGTTIHTHNRTATYQFSLAHYSPPTGFDFEVDDPPVQSDPFLFGFSITKFPTNFRVFLAICYFFTKQRYGVASTRFCKLCKKHVKLFFDTSFVGYLW